jgi:hypothetical protein
MSDSVTRVPRTVERRVAMVMVQYLSPEVDVNGQRIERLRTAYRGELATLTVSEAARIDALGGLAPEGHTAEMITADLQAVHAAYAAERSRVVDNWSGGF